MNKKHIVAVVAVCSAITAGVIYASCGSCGACADKASDGAGVCTRPGASAAGQCTADAKQCGTTCPMKTEATSGAEAAKISTETLKTLLRSGAATVLDARTATGSDGSRIPGAKALSPDTTAEQAAKAIPSKDALVVTYCANVKCPASHKLASKLAELGYSNILEYPEGIQGWKDAGNNVQSDDM